MSKTIGYSLGFVDMEESDETLLKWQGTPPGWLRGSLFRNGPGRYDRGKVEVNHWFDGLALLHALRISPQGVCYHSRFLRSHDFRVSHQEGLIGSPGFACDPCRSLFRKIASAFMVDATDNPNINLIEQGDQFLALTELPMPMVFDPQTLGSKYRHEYGDKVPQGSTTAHPHQDRGYLYNQVLHYSAFSSYRLYRQRGLKAREEFARVSVDEISYTHSFGLSGNHCILTCCPLQVAPWKLLLRNRPFIENFEWKPQAGTRFHIVPRPGAKGFQRTFTTEPFFFFHHVNSFEEPGGVLWVDLIAYPNPDIIQQLKLDHLRNEKGIDFGKLRRYRLDVKRGKVQRAWESKHVLELSRINYSAKNTRPYRFVYGVSAEEGKSLFYDRLIKLDSSDDSALYWQEESTFPGEPIFVACPEAKKEDDGILLSIVLSPERECSFLLLLDASTLTELARVWLPSVVPHGFHGLFSKNIEKRRGHD